MHPELKSIHLSEPAIRALEAAGVDTLDKAAQFTGKQLLSLHGFGPKGLRLLQEALKAHGLTLKE